MAKKFRTIYDEPTHYYSNPGCTLKDELAPTLDKYGNRIIESKGQMNLYAYIQSWADECDINILMAKFTNGDRTALMQRVGEYLDLSNIPDNFNDMLNITTKAGAVFDSLPTDVKKIFGNNVNNFLSNSQTEEFRELLNKSPEDLRREKVLNSKENTRLNATMVETIKKPEPIEELIINAPEESLTDEIKSRVFGKVKLNEQKQ